MKIRNFVLLVTAIILLSAFKPLPVDNDLDWAKKGVEHARYQLKLMIKSLETSITDSLYFPRSVTNKRTDLVGAKDWTSGFFPGSLWYAYELTNDNEFAVAARKYTNFLSNIQYYKENHDVGFMMYCSYGNAYRLKPNKTDSLILINSAKSLSTRFDTKVGMIKSWDKERWKFPVIIDNMMNLELLFEASKMSGDSSFRNIAIKHADRTMKTHFRPDMSSYHIVSFNSETGAVETKETYQGYSNSSSWARGQAWGLYGFTTCYIETKQPRYMKQAKAIAAYIMTNKSIPEDLIPYWDYNAVNIPNAPRDASAAAITASALIKLSQLVPNGTSYIQYAEKILKSLSGEKYLAAKGKNNGFILMHSTGNLPANSEIDAPLNYADYYYLEGLKEYINLIDSQQKLATK